MGQDEPRVVIGMDPHKRSVTIEVMTADEAVVGGGRFGTDVEGFAAMLRMWLVPGAMWAIEGCSGIGRHIAHRLLAEGDQEPSMCRRSCRSGPGYSRPAQGRKTDAADAHSVALVGAGWPGYDRS